MGRGQERKSSSPDEKFQVLFGSFLPETADGDGREREREDWEKTLLQERTDSKKGTFL